MSTPLRPWINVSTPFKPWRRLSSSPEDRIPPRAKLTASFPTGQAVVGLVSGKERKRGKKGECFGKRKPAQQWCRYPNPNVVPETGVWIIGDGESLPFRKIFTNAPGPKPITKDKGGVTNEKEDQEGNPGSVSRRTVATSAECRRNRYWGQRSMGGRG